MSRKADAPDTPSLGWLTAGLAMAALPLVAFLPPWIPVIYVLLAVWRLRIEHRVAPLPSLPVRLVLFVLVCVGVFAAHGTLFRTTAALSLLIALLGLKLVELKGQRDFVLTSYLGFFVMLTSFFYSQSLLLTVWMMLAAPVLVAGLVRSQAGRGARVPTKECLRRGSLALLLALPFALVLFLLFPRVETRSFMRIGQHDIGVTGMSDELNPGTFASMTQSDEPAFRVDFPDGNVPAETELYWRGPVLVSSRGLEWRRGEPPHRYGKVPAHPTDAVRQIVTLEPHNNYWLFALDRPVSWVRESDFYWGQILMTRRPVTRLTRYDVVSANVSLDPPLYGRFLEPYLKVEGEPDPEIVKLAQSFRAGAASDAEVVQRGLAYFQNEGFLYSFKPGSYAGRNGLAEFLFNRKKGFCEHYAAAFATLMRLAGVPSRLVLGYQGGTLNRSGNYIIVRQNDAHAWVEVYLEGKGWTREDPTAAVAPDRLEFGMQRFSQVADEDLTSEERRMRLLEGDSYSELQSFQRSVVDLWDHVNFQWNLLVVGYDNAMQDQVGGFLGIHPGQILPWLIWSTVSIFILMGLVALAFWCWKHRPTGDLVAREAGRLVDQLARTAGPRRPSESLAMYCARASGGNPGLQAALHLYLEVRYGRGKNIREAAASLRKARLELKK